MSENERQRVSIDAQAWQQISTLLTELPYKISAPIVAVIQQTGGVVAIHTDAALPTGQIKEQ